MRTPVVLLLLLALLAPGCGGSASAPPTTLPGGSSGGGSGGGTGPDVTPPPVPPGNPGPQVALVLVSGHTVLGPAADYLTPAIGSYLVEGIVSAGYTVESFGFADDGAAANGYDALLAKLRQIRDTWVVGQTAPTKVVIVGHSHGGVWAHAATRDVPDLPVRALVDLDVSSVGWGIGHAAEAVRLGGSPENAYTIAVNVAAPLYPAVTSEPGFSYDLEDVVFPNVRDVLEVVSGELTLNTTTFAFERYDERWSARPDTTTTGITQRYTATSHVEVATPPPVGTTIVGVRTWIVTTLGTP